MILEGTYQFNSPREALWEFISDPARVGKCLPDLKALEIQDENHFLAVIRVGVGPIKSDFKFKIEITEKEPPHHARLRAAGTGSGSSVNLDTMVELQETASGSSLTQKSDVKIGGMMASLGQRMINETAAKTVQRIFENMQNQLG